MTTPDDETWAPGKLHHPFPAGGKDGVDVPVRAFFPSSLRFFSLGASRTHLRLAVIFVSLLLSLSFFGVRMHEPGTGGTVSKGDSNKRSMRTTHWRCDAMQLYTP